MGKPDTWCMSIRDGLLLAKFLGLEQNLFSNFLLDLKKKFGYLPHWFEIKEEDYLTLNSSDKQKLCDILNNYVSSV